MKTTSTHMIPDIRGKPITNIHQTESEYPTWQGTCGTITMTVKQPQPTDRWAIEHAARRCSTQTTRRFLMTNLPHKKPGEPPTIYEYPPWKPGTHGLHFPVMQIGTEIVGFARHRYAHAKDMPHYKVTPPDTLIVEGSLLIIDPYQRHGLGTLYAQINKHYSKAQGATHLVGTTYIKHGLMKIRLKDGFTLVDILPGGQCRIRGKL